MRVLQQVADSLTVHGVEGVGLFFVGGFRPADDLQHGALRLRGLRGQRIVIRVLLSVRLRAARTDSIISRRRYPGLQLHTRVSMV